MGFTFAKALVNCFANTTTGTGLIFLSNMSAHSDQLKHRHWQERRLRIYERDNFSCQATNCDKTNDTLEVHHVDYWPGLKLWEYPDDMLITLCHNCHSKEQERDKLETHLANTLKMKGFLVCDLFAFSCKLNTDGDFTRTLLKTLRDFQK